MDGIKLCSNFLFDHVDNSLLEHVNNPLFQQVSNKFTLIDESFLIQNLERLEREQVCYNAQRVESTSPKRRKGLRLHIHVLSINPDFSSAFGERKLDFHSSRKRHPQSYQWFLKRRSINICRISS